MRAFTAEHLPALCLELAQWQDTGLLPDGRMRELAALCAFDPDNRLRNAERMVEHAAIRAVAERYATAQARPEPLSSVDRAGASV